MGQSRHFRDVTLMPNYAFYLKNGRVEDHV
jgi:hypothetical protein